MSIVKKIVLMLALLLLSGCGKKTAVVIDKPKLIITPTITVVPTAAIPTPTVKPVTIEDLNKKYGPCTKVSVLMYHHIQAENQAKKNGQINLTVTPEFFQKQMQYLKDKSYSVIGMTDLINFFNNNTTLPKKAVIITLDDAYEDNYTNAFPILKEFGFKAMIFTPTGLVNNFDYLNWNQINEMNQSGLIEFGNHTWSHHSSKGTEEVLDKEINLADTQLKDHGQDVDKVFAYPYGNPSGEAEKILAKYNYSLAFTTIHGNIMCKGQKYVLPRVRVGNAALSSFGL
jgi:peptidoglycan/xylan/chitin deacetylase (PgdA/CDA1 family)